MPRLAVSEQVCIGCIIHNTGNWSALLFCNPEPLGHRYNSLSGTVVMRFETTRGNSCLSLIHLTTESRVGVPLEARYSPNLNRAALHTVFHNHPLLSWYDSNIFILKKDVKSPHVVLYLYAHLSFISASSFKGGGRVVRWCWVNFQCRGVLQFGLQ